MLCLNTLTEWVLPLWTPALAGEAGLSFVQKCLDFYNLLNYFFSTEPLVIDDHQSQFFMPETPSDPEFADAETNVTAQLGGSVFLHCPVVHSGDRAVSYPSVSIFPREELSRHAGRLSRPFSFAFGGILFFFSTASPCQRHCSLAAALFWLLSMCFSAGIEDGTAAADNQSQLSEWTALLLLSFLSYSYKILTWLTEFYSSQVGKSITAHPSWWYGSQVR